jgi:RNAse (barnase) inhibitor barstar
MTTPKVKPILEIDGEAFDSLEGFCDEVSRRLIPGVPWGRNLDAFNDILRGGFGTPSDGFVLRWRNSELSQRRLGYPETVRVLQRRLATCHPTNVTAIRAELDAAVREDGRTVFDVLVKT